jgi:hypothetical protein
MHIESRLTQSLVDVTSCLLGYDLRLNKRKSIQNHGYFLNIYHLIIIISFGLTQSDHIKQPLLSRMSLKLRSIDRHTLSYFCNVIQTLNFLSFFNGEPTLLVHCLYYVAT